MDQEKTMTTKEAADVLNVQKETIRRYIKNGRLTAVTIPGGDYRVKGKDVKDLLRGQSTDKQVKS
jgi:excisionase family DNA binding protein